MRRYNTGWGRGPRGLAPTDFPEGSSGDQPTDLIPPDLIPRRPTPLGDAGPLPIPLTGRLPSIGEMDPLDFIKLWAKYLQANPQSYTNYDALRYASFSNKPLLIGVSDQEVLERATDIRVYLFVINTHAANTLFLQFKVPSTAITGVPLAPGNGFFLFDSVVPQDSVHIIANAAGTTGVMLFGELPASRLQKPAGFTVT